MNTSSELKDILDELSQHPIFESLDKAEMESIADIVSRKSFKKDEKLFDTAGIPNFLFFIESGKFEVLLSNNERIELSSGQMIGEIAVINGDFRSGSANAMEDSTVIQICGTRLFKDEFVEPKVALKIVRALSKKITSYLRSKEQISTRELLEIGENDQVEYKSSLRWNIHIQKKDKNIENASLKTIAAFLNSSGGTLLIGVADDSSIVGLEADTFESNDHLLLHISTLIKDRISPLHAKYIHLSIEAIEGPPGSETQSILRVDCKAANSPAYLDTGKEEHFYIRTGPATTNLKASEIYPYIKSRFYGES